jgi:hypothetical protein
MYIWGFSAFRSIRSKDHKFFVSPGAEHFEFDDRSVYRARFGWVPMPRWTGAGLDVKFRVPGLLMCAWGLHVSDVL